MASLGDIYITDLPAGSHSAAVAPASSGAGARVSTADDDSINDWARELHDAWAEDGIDPCEMIASFAEAAP
jgi:hypothetical protein